MNDHKSNLLAKIATKKATVAVIGLGGGMRDLAALRHQEIRKVTVRFSW